MPPPGVLQSRVALAGLGAICLAAFLFSIPFPRADGQLLGGDGFGYYVYLPSVVIDHDLDFTNQFERLRPTPGRPTQRTPTGLLSNPWPVGPALLWAPFFLAAHALAIVLDVAGARIPLDGCGYWYQSFVIAGNVIYGAVAVLLAFEVSRRAASAAAALWACVTVLCAGNMIYYLTAEPSMAHAVSAFAVGAFYLAWTRSRGRRGAGRAALLGALAGLVAIVRTQEILLVLVPMASDLADAVRADPGRRRSRPGGWLIDLGVFACAAAVVYSPQLVVSHVLFGNWWSPPQLHADPGASHALFDWSSPHLVDSLVSPWRGLFTWHPVYAVALIGVVPLWRRDRTLAIAALVGVLGQAYVIGGWFYWWQGRAFGGRTFIGCLPLFAAALAALIDRALDVWRTRRRLVVTLAAVVAALLVTANLLLFVEYRLVLSRTNSPATWHDLGPGRIAFLFGRPPA
jgi:hypothetical protein